MSKWQVLKEYLGVVMGTAVIAAAFNMFMTPNQIAAGGISGLGVVLYYLFNIPVGLTIFYSTYRFCHRRQAVWLAVYYTWFIWLCDAVAHDRSVKFSAGSDRGLVVSLFIWRDCDGYRCGHGFQARGTTGGTDLAAQVLNKLFGFPWGKVCWE